MARSGHRSARLVGGAARRRDRTATKVFPALPLAPLLLVAVYGLLGVYTSRPTGGALEIENGLAWPVIRLVVAALFAWSASLLTGLDGGAQLALWALFVALDVSRAGLRALRISVASTGSSVGSWSATR